MKSEEQPLGKAPVIIRRPWLEPGFSAERLDHSFLEGRAWVNVCPVVIGAGLLGFALAWVGGCGVPQFEEGSRYFILWWKWRVKVVNLRHFDHVIRPYSTWWPLTGSPGGLAYEGRGNRHPRIGRFLPVRFPLFEGVRGRVFFFLCLYSVSGASIRVDEVGLTSSHILLRNKPTRF